MNDHGASIRARISAPLWLGAVTLLVSFLVYARWYSHYSLYWDDPAVLGASAGSPKEWFTHGFSHYFLVYPEWSVPYTDFLRPGVNGILRLDQILFGHYYIFYFLLFYAAQFLLIWLVVRMAREMGVQQQWMLLLAFLLAVEPAFINEGLICLSIQFDVWCGLFAVAAFYFLSRERYALALISLTLSVFTKETALYAPIAAALTVAYGTRRKVLAGTMLLPLAAWLAARRFVFIGSGLNGIYAVPDSSPKGILVSAIKGMLIWPSGLLEYLGEKQLFNDILLHSLSTLILLSVNLFLWIFLLVAGVKLLRTDKAALLSPLTAYIWLCGALSFGVLVGHYPRFGGSIYPLELLLLAVTSAALPLSRWRTATLAALCLMAPVFLWNMLHVFPPVVEARSHNRDSMQRLMDALRHNGEDADVIYILNSVDSFSAPEYLARLAGIPGRIVVLNQFDGCQTGSLGSTAISQTGASEMKIALQLPPCTKLVFDGLDPYALQSAVGGTILRGDFARYALPEAKVAGHGGWVNPRFLEIDLGRSLNITLEGFNPRSSVLLYYDWVTGQYRCVGEQCAAS